MNTTTSNQPILIIGGTGMLGQPVSRQLLADGFPVRLLARTPTKAHALLGDGFEIVQGDVTDPAALRRAMQGCAGVHINLKGGPSAADFERMEHIAVREIATAAGEVGVGRVTLISSYAVSEAKGDTPESKAKYKGEQALKQSGVPYTIFRCSWFMETLPLFVQGSRLSLVGDQRHPLHWVAAADYGRMVSRSYQLTQPLNQELSIYGPEAMTMRQALEVYRENRDPHLQIAPISTRMLGFLGLISFKPDWRSLATLMGHYERHGEDGDPTLANELLGAPQITLRQWCALRQ